jgi:hypothetical protein
MDKDTSLTSAEIFQPIGNTKNLGMRQRKNGKTIYRQYWSDNPNENEIMIWVSTEFEPEHEENHVSFIKHPSGWEWGYSETVGEHNQIEDDFADVLAYMREHYKDADLTPEKFMSVLWEQFDFSDM